MKLYTYRESLEGKDQIGVGFDEVPCIRSVHLGCHLQI